MQLSTKGDTNYTTAQWQRLIMCFHYRAQNWVRVSPSKLCGRYGPSSHDTFTWGIIYSVLTSWMGQWDHHTHTHAHKSVDHLISRSHNILYEHYGEHPCLSTRVDTTQSATMLAISKHSHAIASGWGGFTIIVGLRVWWQLTMTNMGISSTTHRFFLFLY